MARKIVENLFYVGLAGLFGGLIYYNVNNQWDWVAQVAVYGGAALVLLYLAFNFRTLRTGFRSRSGRYGTTALTVVLLVLGILVLLNFLNHKEHKRYDLSASKMFQISEQSQKVVKNLKAPIEIIGFYQDSGGAGQFQDLMKEYRYASTKVNSKVVDPQKEPGSVTQYNVQRNGQVVVVNGPRREIVDQATEEKVTNAIIKVTRDREKTVYFLKGHGEKDINDSGPEGYSAAKEAITKQNYQVKDYNLAQENKIPDDASIIVSVGPTVDFFANEANLLNQYLANGGKLLILADPQTDFKMTDFLATYGMSLTGKMVIDASGFGRVLGLGPAAPLVADYADHPITKEMRVMTFYPKAESIKQVPSSAGYKTARLFSSSSRSWAESNLQSNEVAYDEGKDDQGPVDLAVVSTKTVGPPTANNSGGRESRIVLIGDSDFASNAYARGARNLDLFLNTVSWLAEDTDLIAVRPREPENRMVNLTFQQSKLIFWGTVILLPLIALGAGLGVWYKRR